MAVSVKGKHSYSILPCSIYHTLRVNPLVIMNQKFMYNILFRSVSERLLELSKYPKRLGARTGFIGILHTWGQNLMDHPHIHCVVPGGGLSPVRTRWVSCREGFFIPVRVMSSLFRGKFLDYLKYSFEAGDLIFPGGISYLKAPHTFEAFRSRFYHKKWVVYCKPPFDGAEGVLQYLGRYTHRIAISNNRIVKVQDGNVSFHWRDYADRDKQKTMTLKASEFIKRFLLHVLPVGFMKTLRTAGKQKS
jgi:hypothetical protein